MFSLVTAYLRHQTQVRWHRCRWVHAAVLAAAEHGFSSKTFFVLHKKRVSEFSPPCCPVLTVQYYCMYPLITVFLRVSLMLFRQQVVRLRSTPNNPSHHSTATEGENDARDKARRHQQGVRGGEEREPPVAVGLMGDLRSQVAQLEVGAHSAAGGGRFLCWCLLDGVWYD